MKKATLQGTKLDNLTNFSRKNTFQKMALTAISVQASHDDIKELKEVFLGLDVNGDGSLTLEELKQGLAGKENGEKLY